jgi:hypothetical protein
LPLARLGVAGRRLAAGRRRVRVAVVPLSHAASL